MARVVLDTNVIVSAVVADGPARKVFSLARKHPFHLAMSKATYAELSGVLARPKFSLDPTWVLRFLLLLSQIAIWFEPGQRLHVVANDDADNRFLELALAAGADLPVGQALAWLVERA